MAVDVDGCTVTGAAHGDLSSEKVYVRFRTMTCAGPEPGTVIETDVAGFVAGSGKTGVRGPVVSREGALVEKAFLAGVVSGLGQGVSQAFQPQAVALENGGELTGDGKLKGAPVLVSSTRKVRASMSTRSQRSVSTSSRRMPV